MTTGSCLCGTVRYEASGPFKWMAHCHCSMCRKHHGSLYSSNLGADPAKFRWVAGEKDVVHYQSSASLARAFCGKCGSPVPDIVADTCFIPAGSLDDDPGIKPGAHIFVGSKSPMEVITDALPQFEAYPPGYGDAVAGPPAQAPKAGVVQGGCLCGDIAFEISAAPQRMVNCHCSRCRKSRGAAHATNIFTPIDTLTWVRGGEKVKTYKVPDANLFTSAFCGRCGSLLPSRFEAIKLYLVPAGSLDTVLPINPGVNIYVDSKAAWHDITDTLPQFPEMPPRERFREFFL